MEEGLWGRLQGRLSRKWVITVLLVVFAVAATAGGIKYYQFRTMKRIFSSQAYQTALGIINLEQFPKLALSKEQAQKLLPLVRELADKPSSSFTDSSKAAAMQGVLTPEQKDFVKNTAAVKGFKGSQRLDKGIFNTKLTSGSQNPTVSLTQEEKNIILPILREIGQKPNADEAYLVQKAIEIKAVLAAAGVRKYSVEKNNNLLKAARRGGGKGMNKWEEGERGKRLRVGQSRGFGRRVSGDYNFLLEILLQKVYS